jgi:hypothetical protein
VGGLIVALLAATVPKTVIPVPVLNVVKVTYLGHYANIPLKVKEAVEPELVVLCVVVNPT